MATNKSILDMVGGFTGRVNDATYGTAQRLAVKAVRGAINLPIRAVEAVNPYDAESRADKQAQQAGKQYGFTPKFQAQVHSANPTFTQELNSSGLKSGGVATGTNQQGILHRMQLDPRNQDINRTIKHEGLHDVYSTLSPDTKVLYDSLINQAMNQSKDILGQVRRTNGNTIQQDVDPGLRTWLQARTSNYRENQRESFYDISALPESLRNEVHSYVPEYYQRQTRKQQMPIYLKDYYANYYNTGGKATQLTDTRNIVERILGPTR